MFKNKIIIKKIEKINDILNELQYGLTEQIINTQYNQNQIIKKIDKLQEYHEIDDMNSSIVNKKLNQIIASL